MECRGASFGNAEISRSPPSMPGRKTAPNPTACSICYNVSILNTSIGPPGAFLEDTFYRMEKLSNDRSNGDGGEHVGVDDTFAQGGLDPMQGRCPADLGSP